MAALTRIWPLVLIAVLLGALLASGVTHQFSWAGLASRQTELLGWVRAAPMSAALAYVGFYTAVVAIAVPGAVWLTLAGGLLFGTVPGTALAVLGAGSGAVLLFLAARSVLGHVIAARAGPLIARLRTPLERDGFSALLALRLIPVVPFWLSNLAPALVGMRLAPYAAATFLGIIPGTAVFASVGAGLGGVIARGEQPDLGLVFSPGVLFPLLGLALLSLAPIVWRRYRRLHA